MQELKKADYVYVVAHSQGAVIVFIFLILFFHSEHGF